MNAPSSGSWRTRILESLLLLLAIGIGGRLLWDAVGPLIPAIATLFIVGGLFMWLLRGPHARR